MICHYDYYNWTIFCNMSVHAACSTVVRPYKTHLPREGKAPLCSSIHSRSQLAGVFVLEVLSICKNLLLTQCVTNCGSWNWGQNGFQRSLWLLLLQINLYANASSTDGHLPCCSALLRLWKLHACVRGCYNRSPQSHLTIGVVSHRFWPWYSTKSASTSISIHKNSGKSMEKQQNKQHLLNIY